MLPSSGKFGLDLGAKAVAAFSKLIIVHWTHREWSMSLPGLAKAGVSPQESVISVSHTVNTHSEQHKEDYLESIALLSHFKSQSPGRIIQILQGKKKHTFFNISTALGQDVPQTPLGLYDLFTCTFLKAVFKF